MEDGPGHSGGPGLEDDLKGSDELFNLMNGSVSSQRISENGVRPANDPGWANALPIGRLGALVFQPDNSDKLYWASLWAATRIAGCALGHGPADTCWENVVSESRRVCLLKTTGKTLGRWCWMMGSPSRYCSPPFPPALHLDRDPIIQRPPLGFCATYALCQTK